MGIEYGRGAGELSFEDCRWIVAGPLRPEDAGNRKVFACRQRKEVYKESGIDSRQTFFPSLNTTLQYRRKLKQSGKIGWRSLAS